MIHIYIYIFIHLHKYVCPLQHSGQQAAFRSRLGRRLRSSRRLGRRRTRRAARSLVRPRHDLEGALTPYGGRAGWGLEAGGFIMVCFFLRLWRLEDGAVSNFVADSTVDFFYGHGKEYYSRSQKVLVCKRQQKSTATIIDHTSMFHTTRLFVCRNRAA